MRNREAQEQVKTYRSNRFEVILQFRQNRFGVSNSEQVRFFLVNFLKGELRVRMRTPSIVSKLKQRREAMTHPEELVDCSIVCACALLVTG